MKFEMYTRNEALIRAVDVRLWRLARRPDPDAADLAFSCQTPRLVSPILYNPIKETMDSITF
jgi:hypothetical protein